MSTDTKSDLHPEIAHILFMDIVGYSKLLMNEQSEVLQQLNQIVRNTEQFRKAEAAGKLIRIPVGDGMALVFFDSPETPVRAAVEISEALQNYPQIQLRTGIHSGPVNKELDVNDRANVAGAGINMAQRVMGCGDAGHILLSKRVADDLAPFGHWRPQLHDLGDCEVKHGESVFLVNFYNEKIGNRQLPQKLKRARQVPAGSAVSDSVPAIRKQRPVPLVPFVLAGLAAAVIVLFFLYRTASKQGISTSLGAAAGTSIPEKSIAVLPFENLSKDEENAFFAGGVQDEILTNLAKIADLKVISRTSVMKYKSGPERNLREIAKALGVAHILEGSVQRAAARVRVSAQLIDARSDAHLWADHYDRDIADVFAIQSEIAQRIADELRAKLSPQEKVAIASKPTQDMEAYDLYLRAKEIVRSSSAQDQPEKFSQAVNLLEKVVARDPNFVLAHCLLIEASLSLYWQPPHSPADRARAEASLQTARPLAPELGETHFAQAQFYYWGNRDYRHALEALEMAARSLPNSADVFRLSAFIERRLGRWAEAMRHFSRAAELDPRDWGNRINVVQTYHLLRHYSDAEQTADRAMGAFPEAAEIFRRLKGEAALAQGDTKRARAVLGAASAANLWLRFRISMCERNYAEAERLSVELSQNKALDAMYPSALWTALASRAEGNSEKAHSAFLIARRAFEAQLRDRPDDPEVLAQLSVVDAGLGGKEDALRESRRAVELRPISHDAVEGAELLATLAVVYTWIGERDQAIEQLSSLVKLPNSPSLGELKLNPWWDDLRADPRFAQIVADAVAPIPIQ